MPDTAIHVIAAAMPFVVLPLLEELVVQMMRLGIVRPYKERHDHEHNHQYPEEEGREGEPEDRPRFYVPAPQAFSHPFHAISFRGLDDVQKGERLRQRA